MKFTQADVDFVNATLARMTAPHGAYLSQQKAEIASLDSTEDAILIGVYTIRRYMGTEEVKTVRGPIKVERELFEVSVETESLGTRWDPPDFDYVVLSTCKRLSEALVEVVCAEVRSHLEGEWQAEAEAREHLAAQQREAE